MFCPQCGKELPESSIVCCYCAAPMPQPKQSREEPPAPEEPTEIIPPSQRKKPSPGKKNSLWLWIALGIVLLAGIATAIWFLLHPKEKMVTVWVMTGYEYRRENQGGPVQKYEVEYDDAGRWTQITEYRFQYASQTWEKEDYQTRTYDKKGNPIKRVDYVWDEDTQQYEAWESFWEYEYDNKDRIREVTYFDYAEQRKQMILYALPMTCCRDKYAYDQKGNAVRIDHYEATESDGTLEYETENSFGNFTEDIRNINFQKTGYTKLRYHDNGVVKEKVRYDQQGQVLRRETYNKKGNLIGGNTEPFFAGDDWVRTYDKNGRLIRIKNIPEIEGLTETTYTFEYDKNGNLISQLHYLGDRETPNPEIYCKYRRVKVTATRAKQLRREQIEIKESMNYTLYIPELYE